MARSTTKATPRDRVLDAAETLFMSHGYRAVRLKDVADVLGVKVASLYYHAPGGKEDLFTQVLQRSLRRHSDGIQSAIAEAPDQMEAQLMAAARWLCSQPRMNMVRMLDELEVVDPELRGRFSDQAYESIMYPIRQIFAESQAKGACRDLNPDMLAGGLLAVLDTSRMANELGFTDQDPVDSAAEMIGVFVHGLTSN